MVTTTFADGPNDEDGGLIEIAIKIPAGRLADFYRMLGQWMAGAVVGGDESVRTRHLALESLSRPKARDGSAEQNDAACRESSLRSSPPTQIPGMEQTSSPRSPESKRSVWDSWRPPAWRSRYFARECRRPLPIEIEPRNGGSIYWMKADIAGLMLTALRGEVPPAAQR